MAGGPIKMTLQCNPAINKVSGRGFWMWRVRDVKRWGAGVDGQTG